MQILSHNLVINQLVLEGLELLFNLAPPSILKRSLTELFFSRLCNTEPENYKEDMK